MISQERQKQLRSLLQTLAVELEQYDLLNVALTHPSYVLEKG